MKAGAWRWLLVVAYAAGIFYLSHQPGWPFSVPEFVLSDKLIHLGVFGGLAALILFALGERARQPAWIGLAVGLVVVYGALDEFHQSFIPGRAAEVGDAVADGLGALLVGAVHFFWSRGRARNP